MSDQKIKSMENASSESAPAHDDSARSGAGAIKKVATVASVMSGYKYAKKNISDIKHRASFPLLRKVLRKELDHRKSKPVIVDAMELSDTEIDRSYFWHTIIVAITIPALIWSLFILTKALGIGIKFDVWAPGLNPGLYTSIPMVIFTASKLAVSWHSRKAFKRINMMKGRES